jgi:DNA processing protein
MNEDLKYQIALTLIPGVGAINAKKLIGYCGGVEAVLREKKAALSKIPGVGEIIAKSVAEHDVLGRAEEEVEFVKKNSIKTYFFLDSNYPSRLKHCEDGPILFFCKGDVDFNTNKVVGVIGTRNMTEYGKEKCEEIIKGLVPHDALIVSGLAYGVDSCAHKVALDTGLETIAVLGHGLDRIYPAINSSLAKRIEGQGALVSDFVSKTKPDRENFPKRNRIIAGLCDAVIVIEAAVTGGALITADIANSYNRDVFALPGRTTDAFSKGCNSLIKINKANLLESVADVEYIMGWTTKKGKQTPKQQAMFAELDPKEEVIVEFLKKNHEASIDYLVSNLGNTVGQTSAILLGLEFKGVVKQLPGKIFKLSV